MTAGTRRASPRRLDKIRERSPLLVAARAMAPDVASRRHPQVNPGRIHASLQFQRRSRGAPRRSVAPGRRRDARLARQRHVGDGDEPSRQGIHQHRRQGGSGPAHAARDPRQLQGAVPARRRHRRKRDHPDEPSRRPCGRRLRQHRRVVEEVDQGSEEVLHRQRRGVGGGQELHLRAGTADVEADEGCRLRPRLHQRNDRRRRIPVDAGHGRGSARRRHVVAHPLAGHRRRRSTA